ncbi:MAG TPA: hypothetical protein VF644_03050 [Pyrinomonadaceae bacterium]|jgi:hypothetical protein
MKNQNARFITTPAPANNLLPFVKTCASCIHSEKSATMLYSEVICTLWKMRLQSEHGCTSYLGDAEEYYKLWRDSEETALHPSAETDADPLVNAVNVELQTESAKKGDRAFGIPIGFPYKNRRLEDWEN